jgi:glycosyltransferase involved in cell wall biosynthesis
MSSRILVISPIPVLPATAGNRIRIWAMMNNLRAMGHDVWFMGLGLKPEEADALRRAWGEQLFIVPHVKARDARPRRHAVRRWILDRMIARGWAEAKVDHRFWPHWHGAVAEIARREKFDVVIAEYVFCSMALLHFHNSLKVVDTHDLFTDRAARLRPSGIQCAGWSLSRKEEARGLMRADVVIAIQKHEAKFFDELTQHSRRIVTVGHTVTLNPLPATNPAAQRMLFVGTGNGPNIAGIRHFIAHVLPVIRHRLPGATLQVAGGICAEIPACTPGVELLGIVDCLESAYAGANIVINPLLAGTGLKTKTVEALGYGKALVTTPCGAEGIEDAAGDAFYLANDDAAMVEHVCRLLQDPAEAEALARRAFEFARLWNEAQLRALATIPTGDEGRGIEPASFATTLSHAP